MKLTTLKIGTLALALFVFSFADAQEKKKPTPEKMFKNLDINEDGAISLEEFKGKKNKKGLHPEKLEKVFARIDIDANGSITLEEFKKIAINKGNKKQK